MGDYHVHLHPHGEPAPGTPAPGTFPRTHLEAYVEAAAARGVEEVCFTEHLFRMVESEPVLGEFWRDETEEVAAPTVKMIEDERVIHLEDYVTAIVEARDSGLPILLGLEIDYFPETIDAVLELLSPYPWDLLLGSVHWIGGFAVDDAEIVSEFDRRGVDVVFAEYFELERQLAASGAVDVLAHADVVKNHGHVAGYDLSEAFSSVAAAAAASQTLVEVSSAGLLEPCAEIYPSIPFLRAFHEAGVAITMATDTHSPEGTGWGFDQVAEHARSVGYANRARFANREHNLVELG